MLRYRDGDAGAFDRLYQRHKGGIYRFLLRQCANAAEAEELFQEVWMNVVRSRRQYAVRAKFTTFLYRVAHNRLIDHWRRRPKGIPVSFDSDECAELEELASASHEQPDARYDASQKIERFKQLLAGLPEAQREAFLLHQETGMSVDQIADATGVNRETAKSRLRYALGKLRHGMQGML
jgi:RNA polymerase sigma-70 factor (ECF subfamily)